MGINKYDRVQASYRFGIPNLKLSCFSFQRKLLFAPIGYNRDLLYIQQHVPLKITIADTIVAWHFII